MVPGDEITLCRYKVHEYEDQYGIKHFAYKEVDVHKCIVISWMPTANGYRAEAKSNCDGLIFKSEGGGEDMWYCDEQSGCWLRKSFAGRVVIHE